MKAPQAIGWWIKTRAVADPTWVLGEKKYESEDSARDAFDALRATSEEHGGSAVLLHDGCYVASFSHWGRND